MTAASWTTSVTRRVRGIIEMAAWLFLLLYAPWWVLALIALLLVCSVLSLFEQQPPDN